MTQEHNPATTAQTAELSDHGGHPTSATYFKVAMILSAITAFEVGIFYIVGLGHWIIPLLVILSGAKFALVVMFYMHLKYDDRLFTTAFVGGLSLAFLVVLTLMALFRWFA